MSRLVDATLLLLREESACQQPDDDGDIEDDDDTEHDEVLMDAVSDLLPAFAKSMGPHFAPIFAKLFDPLMKFSVSWRLITATYVFPILALSSLFLIQYLTSLITGKCRNLHAPCKIGPWWLLALLKLLKTWVLQLRAMLM
jgi:hypothetical protein